MVAPSGRSFPALSVAHVLVAVKLCLDQLDWTSATDDPQRPRSSRPRTGAADQPLAD